MFYLIASRSRHHHTLKQQPSGHSMMPHEIKKKENNNNNARQFSFANYLFKCWNECLTQFPCVCHCIEAVARLYHVNCYLFVSLLVSVLQALSIWLIGFIWHTLFKSKDNEHEQNSKHQNHFCSKIIYLNFEMSV